LALKREWKEKRQGFLYSRGDTAKKGNANLRLEPGDGAPRLRVNLGNGGYVHALVKTAHPYLKTLLERVYASPPYNVTLQLKEGKVYAHFTWTEELPPPKVAHRVVAVAEEHGVAIATERLKHLRKSRRGDGSGRHFRRKQHRFAYRSLLEKIHFLARKRSVQVLEVNPGSGRPEAKRELN
jgi:IS605 OrfB family transposase